LVYGHDIEVLRKRSKSPFITDAADLGFDLTINDGRFGNSLPDVGRPERLSDRVLATEAGMVLDVLRDSPDILDDIATPHQVLRQLRLRHSVVAPANVSRFVSQWVWQGLGITRFCGFQA